MAVEVSTLKVALRIDGDDDDTLLSGYIKAAQIYVQNAVGTDLPEFWTDNNVMPLYDMAVQALAGAWYDYRIALADVQSYPIDLALNSIIGQLRGLYDQQVDAGGESNG